MTWFCAFCVVLVTTVIGLAVQVAIGLAPFSVAAPDGPLVVTAQVALLVAVRWFVSIKVLAAAALPVSGLRQAPSWMRHGVQLFGDPAPGWMLVFTVPCAAGVWLTAPLALTGPALAAVWGLGLIFVLTLAGAILRRDDAWRLALPFNADEIGDTSINDGEPRPRRASP